ncbi:universal stress protein [Deinococcus aestuarii]|uniref:universal stress protein n=1 Tax=Deinococcus aestuarii TaxID=2774531 RepID=UPI001C0BDC28
MIRRVLVPFDFSEGARAALDLARSRFPGAQVDVLHVVDGRQLGLRPVWMRDPRGGVPDTPSERERREVAVRQAQARLNEELGGGLAVEGFPVETIVERAQTQGYALVVISPRGKSGLHRAVLGSVAEGVVRQARVPVLVLHSKVF